MDGARLHELIVRCGFEAVGEFDAGKLLVREEVRAMCHANRCQRLGKSWLCPPAVGTIEECRELLSHYRRGIVFQSIGHMEDDFDVETLGDTIALQAERFNTLVTAALEEFGSVHDDPLLMSASYCGLCQSCTCPDEPCRFPDRACPSLEAYGVVVADACGLAGIPYYHGKGTIAFIAVALFDNDGRRGAGACGSAKGILG